MVGRSPVAGCRISGAIRFLRKTIVPFGIHHGSRFGRILEQCRDAEPKATVLDGFTIDADTSNEEVLKEFGEYLDTLRL